MLDSKNLMTVKRGMESIERGAEKVKAILPDFEVETNLKDVLLTSDKEPDNGAGTSGVDTE